MSDSVIPVGWRDTELGQVGSFFRGRGGTRDDERPNGLPCIRYGDLYTHHDCIVRSFTSSISPESASSYTRLRTGDVVFAGSGETFEEIGKAAAYCDDRSAYAGSDTIIFRPGSDLFPKFAGYAVNGQIANAHKSRMGQGSSVIHIGAEQLAQIRLLLPPIKQQQRIAEILSSVDDAIKQAEALIDKMKKINAGLMRDLFTRGVTPDGVLRPPCDEIPKLYRESPLGWTPMEWESTTIGQVSTVVRGSTPRPAKDPRFFDGSFVPWITVGELSRDEWPYLTTTTSCLTEAGALHSRFLDSGTVVLSNSGFGCGVPKILQTSGCANDGIAAFLNLSDLCIPLFLYYYLFSQIQTLRTRIARGVDQPNLNTDMLREFPLPLPATDEQSAIAECLFSVTTQLRNEEDFMAKLRATKRGLMHDLLTGFVRVPLASATE